MQEMYNKFIEAKRSDVKLELALKAYLRLEQRNQRNEQWETYRRYLEQRRRAAWELLIREENLEGLRLFAKEGWLQEEDVSACLTIANRMGKRESQLWLLQFQWKKPETAHPVWIEKNMTAQIITLLQEKLQNTVPAAGGIFPCLTWKQQEEYNQFGWGTNGRELFFKEKELMDLFRKQRLERYYLHSLFHCLFFHMFGTDKERERWDIACDVAVEWAIDESGWFPLTMQEKNIRKKWYALIFQKDYRRDTKTSYEKIKKLSEEEVDQIKKMFCMDEHGYWYQDEDRTKKTERMEQAVRQWGSARRQISLQQEGERNHVGQKGGMRSETYIPKKKKGYDYKKFLQRFSVSREEMILDMESIDYIPYLDGLKRYGNVLLVEPLETTEVKRLEEFVIAIDTSGSCSGEVVRNFLDETYKILSSREHFFKKMNVHIIQCDSMIQDHKVIRCEEDWKRYQDEIKILGLGGTDFTPVFDLVDQMIERKEIKNLKGLMYFSDGDGIFPRKKPAYDTAFVFLKREFEKGVLPDWVIRLYLT